MEEPSPFDIQSEDPSSPLSLEEEAVFVGLSDEEYNEEGNEETLNAAERGDSFDKQAFLDWIRTVCFFFFFLFSTFFPPFFHFCFFLFFTFSFVFFCCLFMGTSASQDVLIKWFSPFSSFFSLFPLFPLFSFSFLFLCFSFSSFPLSFSYVNFNIVLSISFLFSLSDPFPTEHPNNQSRFSSSIENVLFFGGIGGLNGAIVSLF